MKKFWNNEWAKFPFNNRGLVGDPPAGDPPAGDPPEVKIDVNNTPPGGDPPAYKAPELDMATALPPEHRNKEYFKDITFEKLIDQHVNLQSKLGQRPDVGVPGAEATPEQITAFYNSLRPKDMSEYAFPETEFSKANGRDEGFQTGMKQVFHDAGVSQHQVNKITEGYDKIAGDIKATEEAKDTEFDTKISEIYKDSRETALGIAKNLMRENIPDDLKPELENLDNRSLLLLTTTLNAVHKKYISEDGIGPSNRPATGDPVALREEAMQLMKTPAYKDFRDPGYDVAQQKVKDLYSQIAEIQKGASATKK